MLLTKKYGDFALVTGATEGIGKDFALELARQGFSLYLVARNETKLKSLQTELSKMGAKDTKVLSLDLSESKNINQLFEITKDISFGLIVHAAGFGSGGPLHELSLENEMNMVDLNCRSVVQMSHHYIQKSIQKQRKLGLILFGSLVGFQGVPWTSTYAASKAFVQSFAEGIHREYRSKGIDVLSVAPGPVASGFGSRAGMKMSMAQSSKGIAKICLKALGKTETIRPGFLSKFLGWSLITLPRKMRSILLQQIMHDMIFPKGAKS
ncbi:KR domain protein [Leptospira ryugenii]|uniref:KR domain protein n=1 Tax=Leptospira ryugenii TaxID=1917863 RepID=A0A2P2E4E5_9LEPT|nr:SDR family NAD(P)-dependent oxidoreductase [Leptospira ryugenii]GBF51750.1 KR domain protein [Leptospira ryugenii]